MIPLAVIVEAAQVLSIAVPALVTALRSIGCAIEGCSETETPQPADIPTGEKGQDAMHRLRMKAAGFDSRQDPDELPRHTRAEKLAEGVVVIRRRPT